uniref:Uncharacterized protein n=1 Tax=Mycena chlorophos TaxID=658473 RepID=A0ABQ0L5W7_MYCCL|nr:predicted protein [Mycena chlorophos]
MLRPRSVGVRCGYESLPRVARFLCGASSSLTTRTSLIGFYVAQSDWERCCVSPQAGSKNADDDRAREAEISSSSGLDVDSESATQQLRTTSSAAQTSSIHVHPVSARRLHAPTASQSSGNASRCTLASLVILRRDHPCVIVAPAACIPSASSEMSAAAFVVSAARHSWSAATVVMTHTVLLHRHPELAVPLPRPPTLIPLRRARTTGPEAPGTVPWRRSRFPRPSRTGIRPHPAADTSLKRYRLPPTGGTPSTVLVDVNGGIGMAIILVGIWSQPSVPIPPFQPQSPPLSSAPSRRRIRVVFAGLVTFGRRRSHVRDRLDDPAFAIPRPCCWVSIAPHLVRLHGQHGTSVATDRAYHSSMAFSRRWSRLSETAWRTIYSHRDLRTSSCVCYYNPDSAFYRESWSSFRNDDAVASHLATDRLRISLFWLDEATSRIHTWGRLTCIQPRGTIQFSILFASRMLSTGLKCVQRGENECIPGEAERRRDE